MTLFLVKSVPDTEKTQLVLYSISSALGLGALYLSSGGQRSQQVLGDIE